MTNYHAHAGKEREILMPKSNKEERTRSSYARRRRYYNMNLYIFAHTVCASYEGGCLAYTLTSLGNLHRETRQYAIHSIGDYRYQQIEIDKYPSCNRRGTSTTNTATQHHTNTMNFGHKGALEYDHRLSMTTRRRTS